MEAKPLLSTTSVQPLIEKDNKNDEKVQFAPIEGS
jgi:hypothetical protein